MRRGQPATRPPFAVPFVLALAALAPGCTDGWNEVGWREAFDADWVDSTACAHLLHGGASQQEASSALAKCLVDLVKQSHTDLEDPEEMLLDAAHEARLRTFGADGEGSAPDSSRGWGGSRAGSASRGSGQGTDEKPRPGFSTRHLGPAGGDGVRDRQGRGDSNSANSLAEGDSSSAKGAPSLQDSFVFYVSVAGLSAFFTRSICSYLVTWWPVFEIGLLALALAFECVVLLRLQRVVSSPAALEAITSTCRKAYVVTNLIALVGCVLYCWAEPFLRLVQNDDADAAAPSASEGAGARPQAASGDPKSATVGSAAAATSSSSGNSAPGKAERPSHAQAARASSDKDVHELERRLGQEAASRKRLEGERNSLSSQLADQVKERKRAQAETTALREALAASEAAASAGGAGGKRGAAGAEGQRQSGAESRKHAGCQSSAPSNATDATPGGRGGQGHHGRLSATASTQTTAPRPQAPDQSAQSRARTSALESQLAEAKQAIAALQRQLQLQNRRQQQLQQQHQAQHHHQGQQQARRQEPSDVRKAPAMGTAAGRGAGDDQGQDPLFSARPYGAVGGHMQQPQGASNGGGMRGATSSGPGDWEARGSARRAAAAGAGGAQDRQQQQQPIGLPLSSSGEQQRGASTLHHTATSPLQASIPTLPGSKSSGPAPSDLTASGFEVLPGRQENGGRDILGPPLDFDFSFIEEDLAEEEKNVLRMALPTRL